LIKTRTNIINTLSIMH